MNAHVAKILQELLFFVALVALSECLRRLLRRAKPESRVVDALLICSLVLGWYSVSITLVLLNKWVMTSWEGGLPFPLFYTMSHMMLKGCFALLYLFISCQPLQLPRREPCCGASLVGLMTALDVAASNVSFLFITVAFYTMLKSASLIFILVLGLLLQMEQCSLGIAGTVLLIAFGIFITSYGETEFNATGFWLVIGSELCAAVRWLATQKTLHSSGLSAMQTVLFMSPASSVTLAPIVAVRERHELKFLVTDPAKLGHYLLLVLVPGFLAFLLLLIEVHLVKVTSSLTLAVFGNLKSVVTIIFSIVVFGEKTTLLQWSGLILALTGMLTYARLKNDSSLAVDSLALVRYEALPQDEDPPEKVVEERADSDVQVSDAPKVPPEPTTLGAKIAPVKAEVEYELY